MGLTNNLVLNTFGVFVLTVICVYSFKRNEIRSMQQRLYIAVLLANMLLLILDTLSRTDGKLGTIYPLINQVSNFMLFLLNPISASIWCLYVNFQVFHDLKKIKKLILFLLVPIAINAGIVIISQFTGWYYYIDANNIYHRGPFFVASAMITIVLVVAAFVFSVLNRKKISKRHLFSLLFFPLPPLVGTLLQIFIYGYAFTLISMVISLLMVFLDMNENAIYTDYLTGIGNRKKLDAVLNESIRRSSPRRTFSLIMMDIDDFKKINDTYGHEMGDKALKAYAQMLKECIRSRDFVVRHGGDEFCLVLDVYDDKSLELAICRINKCVDSLNDTQQFPFKLSFAEGHAVYDYQSHLTAEDFIKHVDMLMYENKREKQLNYRSMQYSLY